MASSLETRLVEAGFLVLLAAAAAALHYSYSFHSPFPEFTKAPVRHDPVYNYLLVLGTAAAAYFGTRVVYGTVVAAVPGYIKCSRFARSGGPITAVPAGIVALYILAGSPALEDHVLLKWVTRNWEQRGREDVQWCLRLLVLLLCLQALLGLAVMVLRMAWWVWRRFIKLCSLLLRHVTALLGFEETQDTRGNGADEHDRSALKKLGAEKSENSESDGSLDEDEEDNDAGLLAGDSKKR